MRWLLYLRLIVLTAGTLLPFFWMIVILGHRRQRNFERIFFFLCLALTCFFGSSLLALNAALHYGAPPHGLLRFAWSFLCLGLWFAPPLLVHLHIEYASLRGLIEARTSKISWLFGAYAPTLLLTPKLLAALRLRDGIDFKAPSHQLSVEFQIWLVLSISVAAFWQWKFSKVSRDREEKTLFRELRVNLVVLAIFLSAFIYFQHRHGSEPGGGDWNRSSPCLFSDSSSP